jgi:hypothetical protein
MKENNDAEFKKSIYFVLSRSMLESQYKNLKKSFEELILKIGQETEFIQQDHLARGQIVHAASASASLSKEKEQHRWQWHYYQLYAPVTENDPVEYWGDLSFYGWKDFISATDKYPWMPDPVSVDEMPF